MPRDVAALDALKAALEAEQAMLPERSAARDDTQPVPDACAAGPGSAGCPSERRSTAT